MPSGMQPRDNVFGMYTTVLILHSWLRWIALIAGVGATVMAARDTARPGGSARLDRWGMVLVTVLDLQMLLGLLLYLVVSPNMAEIRANFSASMKDPVARFWAVEHITMMIAAVVLVHVGRVLGRKATTPESKRMKQFICFGIATTLMLLSIPWPGMRAGRPLFRF
jgi:uncharacterized membrane protein YozB (DUF420 family)